MAQPLLATLHKLPQLDTRRVFYEAINAARQARVADLIFDNSPSSYLSFYEGFLSVKPKFTFYSRGPKNIHKDSFENNCESWNNNDDKILDTRRELQDENNSAAYFAPVLNMLLPHI